MRSRIPPSVPPRDLTVPLLEWASMNWIDTILGLTRDQWIVIGLMGSAPAWFVVLGVVQTDEAAIGALISAPPQGLLVHAVLSHMDSRGPSLRRLSSVSRDRIPIPFAPVRV